jgi:hypothetical protein
VLEQATLQILLEFDPDELWERLLGLLSSGQEGTKVLLYATIERRRLWTATLVLGCRHEDGRGCKARAKCR